MDSDDIDKLEQRLQEALAAALREQAVFDPAWGQFRSAVAHRYVSNRRDQNGISSSDEPEDGGESGC